MKSAGETMASSGCCQRASACSSCRYIASRRITRSEFDTCKKNGVTPIEIVVGFDGIVVANSKQGPAVQLTL